jgi:signal transduction histidine kinase
VTSGVRWSTGTLSALALAAIVAPAIVVAVLGWVSLRHWQASAELLFREQARDVAAMAAAKVDMVLRHAEDGFLDRVQGRLAAGDLSEAALDAAAADTRFIRRVYVFAADGHLLVPSGWRDADDASLFAVVPAALTPSLEGRPGKRAVTADGRVGVAAMLSGRGRVFVAYARDLDALRRDVFETSLGALESPTVVAVLDDKGQAVYSRTPLDRAERLLAVALGDTLPDWRIAVYAPAGASPRQAVRWQVTILMGALAVLVGVILAGAVATWRLVRREAEIAQLKADFVANVSHDLKTPLSVIRMFGETLEMGRVPDDGRRREYYRIITRESERLSRLIDNVLDFSRIERGRRVYDIVPTAVEPLVRETLEAFAWPLEQQGFKVEVSIAPDLPDVPMDADAVGQALANLVDNAIKYSGEDRAVTIDARRAGDQVALSVRDRGIGIAAAEHGRIFEKFYRVGRSDTQGRRGSGVGLALVRHVAAAHGGTVTVESAPGDGSCFTLWLPLAERRA